MTDELAAALASRYVFPERAREYAKKVTERARAGAYDGRSPDELGERLTSDLVEWSADKHMRVYFDPEANAQRRAYLAAEAERSALEEPEPTEPVLDPVAASDKFGFHGLQTLPGNVGYVSLSALYGLEDPRVERELVRVVTALAQTDAVVIDLRSCWGGHAATGQRLASHFFAEGARLPLCSTHVPADDRVDESWTLETVAGPRLVDQPVYLLVGPRTLSGAEALSYELQVLERAQTVGAKTAGAAHAVRPMPLGDEYMMWIPEVRPLHPYTGKNWEGTGVTPDVEIDPSQAHLLAHLMALEELLARAPQGDAGARAELEWARDLRRAELSPASVSGELLDEYAGSYSGIELRRNGVRLDARVQDGAWIPLRALDTRTFLPERGAAFRLVFERDERGTIHAVRRWAPGRPAELLQRR